MPGSTTTAATAATAGKRSSSFDKYAAAVLQALPADDEAVQLARMAAVHGYSLSQVLQQQQQRTGSVAGSSENDVITAGGITVTAEGVNAMLVKDPRSGRLSVAAGSSGGSNGGSSGAAELYGDLARWCDPSVLEQTLLKKRQQQQPGRAADGGGAAKRTRLVTL
jgi:hypothetical protein